MQAVERGSISAWGRLGLDLWPVECWTPTLWAWAIGETTTIIIRFKAPRGDGSPLQSCIDEQQSIK